MVPPLLYHVPAMENWKCNLVRRLRPPPVGAIAIAAAAAAAAAAYYLPPLTSSLPFAQGDGERGGRRRRPRTSQPE